MAKRLTDILNNGNNLLLIDAMSKRGSDNPCSPWYRDYRNFISPFDEQVSISVGEDIWKNSYYRSAHNLENNMNNCYLVHKAVYKLFHAIKTGKLGYCKGGDKELFISYPDGTMEEVNDIIKGSDKKQRMIHMHFKQANGSLLLTSGCVSESPLPDQVLEFGGNNGHSIVAYLYGVIAYYWLYAIKPEFKYYHDLLNDLFEAFNNGTLIEEQNQKKLTCFENDFLFFVSDLPQTQKKLPLEVKEDIMDCKSVAKESVKTIFGATTETKKPEVKVVKKRTVGEAVKSGVYKIAHVFAKGDENFVPGNEYDYMELSPQVEEVCAFIKSNEFASMPMNMNFMFTGEAGTGKSTAAAQIAAITGLPYRFLTCSSGTEETELKVQTIVDPNDGSKFINVDSEIVNAVRNGGIIEVQEINMIRREGVASCLNSVLDSIGKMKLLDGSIIKRHPNCIFIFTLNVGYEGARNLNQALMSRCFCKEEFELPEKEKLVERLTSKQKLDKQLATNMVNVFDRVRKVLEEAGETNGVCSWRELESWAEMLVRNKEIRRKISTVPELTPYQAALKSLVSHATEDKDLQAELKAVIANTFAAS